LAIALRAADALRAGWASRGAVSATTGGGGAVRCTAGGAIVRGGLASAVFGDAGAAGDAFAT
jgi:hypothetical protein